MTTHLQQHLAEVRQAMNTMLGDLERVVGPMAADHQLEDWQQEKAAQLVADAEGLGRRVGEFVDHVFEANNIER